MEVDRQARRAAIFAGLHRSGAPLLLANAWDVASAVTIAGAGAKAIASTSAGVAWSFGVPDAADLGARSRGGVIERITAVTPASPPRCTSRDNGDKLFVATASIGSGSDNHSEKDVTTWRCHGKG
jgi:hypothetical protein